MLTHKTKKVIVAILYALTALCTVASVCATLIDGTLLGIDISLTITGTLCMAAASGYGLYRRALDKKIENQLRVGKEIQDLDCVPDAISEKLTPITNIPAALLFFVTDAYKLGNPTVTLVSRSMGSLVWLSNAVQILAVASTRRKQKRKQVEEVTVCGIKESKVNLFIDVENIFNVLLYTIAIYADDSVSPYKVAGNVFWLVAGFLDLLEDIHLQQVERESEFPLSIDMPELHHAAAVIEI